MKMTIGKNSKIVSNYPTAFNFTSVFAAHFHSVTKVISDAACTYPLYVISVPKLTQASSLSVYIDTFLTFILRFYVVASQSCPALIHFLFNFLTVLPPVLPSAFVQRCFGCWHILCGFDHIINCNLSTAEPKPYQRRFTGFDCLFLLCKEQHWSMTCVRSRENFQSPFLWSLVFS